MTASPLLGAEADGAMTAAIEETLEATGLRNIGYCVIIDVDRRRFGAWRPDENIYPASVIKVAIMAEAFRRYRQGSLRPQDAVVIGESNLTTTWGETLFAPGTQTNVGMLVERMITHSDNIATNQLFDVLRREAVTAYMRELGLPTFFLGRKLSGSEPLIVDPEMTGRNRLPPSEIASLLGLIATNAIAGAEEQQEILERCVHGEKLAAGLAPGDRFAHKTGETSEQSHDAGILSTAEGKTYVLVLYTAPPPKPDDSDADHVNADMAAWMRAIRRRL